MLPAESHIRVLHIFGVMDRGGAEMRTLELYRQLNRDRYVFEFCALGGRPGELDEEIRSLGGSVHLLKLDVRFPVRFLRLLGSRRYSAVHSHVHMFTGFILALAAIARVPQRIAHFRSTADGKGYSLWRRGRNGLLQWLLDRSATDIIGVSEAALDLVFGHRWHSDPRCALIYSGVRVEDFRLKPEPAIRAEFGIPCDADLVIHVGRMSPEKNHERLVRIFLRFAVRNTSARLLLVGKRDSAIESRLLQIAGDQAHRISFAGVRTDVGRCLAVADVMLFPSLREGLPGALVEASAAGLPVVASDIPGTAELVDQLPGIVPLDLRDSDDAWAAALSTAIETRHSRNSRFADFPATFDVTNATPKFELLYDAGSSRTLGDSSTRQDLDPGPSERQGTRSTPASSVPNIPANFKER